MVHLADAEKTAERHDGVDRLAAHLVDHDVVDGAELVSLQVVYVGSFDLFCRDQAAGRDLGLFACHVRLRSVREGQAEMLPLGMERADRSNVALPLPAFRQAVLRGSLVVWGPPLPSGARAGP